MAIIFAKKGTKITNPRIRINANSKTINFNAGFFKRYFKKDEEKPKYLRQGYDDKQNQIIIEFCDTHDNIDDISELIKLTYSQNQKSASSVISPILTTFDLPIMKISGIYFEDAIEIDENGQKLYILSVDKRTKV